MIIIGLTGGIACGKTAVTTAFSKEDIPVLDCDLIAREVVEPGTPARKQIVKAFAKDVPDLELPDGSLNRKALGKLVFSNEEKRKLLQSITGRAIFARLVKGFAYHWLIGTPVLLVDAPTLYETKFLLKFCTEIIVVAVNRDTQLKRLMERDGSTEDDARARILAQMPIEEKVQLADIVIWNEGTKEELSEKASEQVARLKARGRGPRVMFSGPGFVLLAAAVIGIVYLRQT